MEYRFFYKVWRILKKKIPFDYPVKLRRKLLSKNDGECKFCRDHFVICIDKKLPEYYAVEVLLHEIGHVLSWDKDTDFHGPNWGKAYSFVYRTYLEITTLNKKE